MSSEKIMAVSLEPDERNRLPPTLLTLPPEIRMLIFSMVGEGEPFVVAKTLAIRRIEKKRDGIASRLVGEDADCLQGPTWARHTLHVRVHEGFPNKSSPIQARAAVALTRLCRQVHNEVPCILDFETAVWDLCCTDKRIFNLWQPELSKKIKHVAIRTGPDGVMLAGLKRVGANLEYRFMDMEEKDQMPTGDNHVHGNFTNAPITARAEHNHRYHTTTYFPNVAGVHILQDIHCQNILPTKDEVESGKKGFGISYRHNKLTSNLMFERKDGSPEIRVWGSYCSPRTDTDVGRAWEKQEYVGPSQFAKWGYTSICSQHCKALLMTRMEIGPCEKTRHEWVFHPECPGTWPQKIPQVLKLDLRDRHVFLEAWKAQNTLQARRNAGGPVCPNEYATGPGCNCRCRHPVHSTHEENQYDHSMQDDSDAWTDYDSTTEDVDADEEEDDAGLEELIHEFGEDIVQELQLQMLVTLAAGSDAAWDDSHEDFSDTMDEDDDTDSHMEP